MKPSRSHKRAAALVATLTLAHAAVAFAAAPPAHATSTTRAAGHAVGAHATVGARRRDSFAAERTPVSVGSTTSKPAQVSGSSDSSTIVRTIVGLFIVIAVIYGLAWIMRQFKRGRDRGASGTGLSSVATLPLGPNRSLSLVRAGRDLLLVGVGEHGVTPIRRYSEEQAIAAGLIAAPDELDDGLVAPTVTAGGGAARWRDLANGGSSGGLMDALRRWTVRQ